MTGSIGILQESYFNEKGESTYLNDGLAAFDFEDLTTTVRSIGQSQIDDLGELGEL